MIRCMGLFSWGLAMSTSMKSIQCAEERIRSAISRGKVPEDPLHAENTLTWVLKLMPNADQALQLAALGHDIDRAIESRRVRKDCFHTFNEFKAAHALNSAAIVGEILEECGVDEEISAEVCRLVRIHETGGDERSEVLKNADALSYFQDNLPFYFARYGWAETKRRSLWGFSRLSPELRPIVAQLSFVSEDLNALLQEVVIEGNEGPRN
jgi:hypothetical protein